MNISIIIPVFNRKEITLSCLRQIFELIGLDDNNNFEIIVVDDGSSDGTSEEIYRKFPRVNVIKGTGEWWYTRSINEGLKFAIANCNPELFILLNDDVVFDRKYFEVLFECYRKNPEFIYGSISYDSGDFSKPVFLGYKKWYSSVNKKVKYSSQNILIAKKRGVRILETYFLPGRGMVFSRSIQNKVGFFDESLPQYGSDFEFTIRARRRHNVISYICLHAILFSHLNMTGKDSTRNKPPFVKFLRSLFNKYSANYLGANLFINFHYGNKMLFPVSIVFTLAGKFRSYFKY